MALPGKNSITFFYGAINFEVLAAPLWEMRWKASALKTDHPLFRLTLQIYRFELLRERMVFNPTTYFFPKCSSACTSV